MLSSVNWESHLNTSRLAARILAALSSFAVILAGLTIVGSAPADAKVRVSDYGFQTSAWGTMVDGDAVGVHSGRTASSYIACTRLTGLNQRNTRSAHEVLAGLQLPSPDSPAIVVSGVESTSKTYSRSGARGTSSRNTVAKVTLGPIVITGLATRATAWADRRGRLHAASTALGGVTLSGDTGTPLDDVLGEVSKPLSTLLDNVPADGLDVPGLGTIHVSRATRSVTSRTAWATGVGLVVELDVPDSTTPVTVTIGYSRARIFDGMVSGVFNGAGWGAEIPSALGGVLAVGRLGKRPLPCRGTGGHVRSNRTAGFDPVGTGLRIGALTGRVYGVQGERGSAKAWTEGRVASVTVGPLHLDGVVGRANVRRTESGAIRRSAAGSTIGSMTVDGTRQSLPAPGKTVCIGSGGTCPVKLTLLERTKTLRGIRVTAARIEVLDVEGVPLGTVITLGNARAVVKRS
jgi:hypothetical protein